MSKTQGTNEPEQGTVVAEDLRVRVTDEIKMRYGSVRRAAEASGMTNTTWGNWLRGRTELTPRLRSAIAEAFDWPLDWPDRPPPRPLPQGSEWDQFRALVSEGASAGIENAARLDLALTMLQTLVDEVRALRRERSSPSNPGTEEFSGLAPG